MNKNLQGIQLVAFNKSVVHNVSLLLKVKRAIQRFIWGSTWDGCNTCCSRCGNVKLGEMKTLSLKYCPVCHFWFKVPK